jgi:hypothetical protein
VSNIKHEDGLQERTKLAHISDPQHQSRVIPPELKINKDVIVTGTRTEVQARIKLMRDHVRGHRPFTEMEASEHHILQMLLKTRG